MAIIVTKFFFREFPRKDGFNSHNYNNNFNRGGESRGRDSMKGNFNRNESDFARKENFNDQNYSGFNKNDSNRYDYNRGGFNKNDGNRPDRNRDGYDKNDSDNGFESFASKPVRSSRASVTSEDSVKNNNNRRLDQTRSRAQDVSETVKDTLEVGNIYKVSSKGVFGSNLREMLDLVTCAEPAYSKVIGQNQMLG